MKLTADTITDEQIRVVAGTNWRHWEEAANARDILEEIAKRSGTVPPLEWLTKSARDAVRIAVCFAGIDCKALVTRLAKTKPRGERFNAATVYRIVAEMVDEIDAEILNARGAK